MGMTEVTDTNKKNIFVVSTAMSISMNVDHKCDLNSITMVLN